MFIDSLLGGQIYSFTAKKLRDGQIVCLIDLLNTGLKMIKLCTLFFLLLSNVSFSASPNQQTMEREQTVQGNATSAQNTISMVLRSNDHNAELHYWSRQPGCWETKHKMFVRTTSNQEIPIFTSDYLVSFIQSNIESHVTRAYLVNQSGVEEIRERREKYHLDSSCIWCSYNYGEVFCFPCCFPCIILTRIKCQDGINWHNQDGTLEFLGDKKYKSKANNYNPRFAIVRG